MSEENDPEGKVKENSGPPEEFVRSEQTGKPEKISDEPPDHAQRGLGSGGGDDPQGNRSPKPGRELHSDPEEKDRRTCIRKKNKE